VGRQVPTTTTSELTRERALNAVTARDPQTPPNSLPSPPLGSHLDLESGVTSAAIHLGYHYLLTLFRMPRVLCVAEKPSIARAITEILSGGRFTTVSITTGYV